MPADIPYVADRNIGWCPVCDRRILKTQTIVDTVAAGTVHWDCWISDEISDDERRYRRAQPERAESNSLAALKRRWSEQLERMQ